MEHLKGLASCLEAVVVAVADHSAPRLKLAAERFHIPRSYTDYRELLDQPDINAVTIALPNCCHAPVALAALQARKHVLLEQPFATSAREAAQVVAQAQKSRRVVMVGQQFRFNRSTQLARACLQRGDLGEVYHARAFWRRRSGIPRIGSWFTIKAQAGGGCMNDLGSQVLDVCLHLLGEFDAVSVSGQTFARFGPRNLGEMDWGKSDIDPLKPCDVEDYGMALIKLKSGRTVWLETSWAACQPDDPREFGLDLLGTNGGMSLFPAKLYRHGSLGQETIHLAQAKVPLPEEPLPHFVDCVLHGTKPLVALTESLRVQQILEAIYTSARSGKEARLK